MLKETFRLNKFISESGYCSRREADRHIENGNVFINGKRASIGDQVKSGDIVKVNGYELEPRESDGLIFIALNKPIGVTSTTEKGIQNNTKMATKTEILSKTPHKQILHLITKFHKLTKLLKMI